MLVVNAFKDADELQDLLAGMAYSGASRGKWGDIQQSTPNSTVPSRDFEIESLIH